MNTINNVINICFIVNPVSGIGKQKIIESLIVNHLNTSKFNYTVLYTKAAKHATELAKEAVKQNVSAVIAVGGDGLINEIAKGLINSNVALGIVPAGSGNGLARHLNIPIDLKKSIQVINSFNITRIDTATINDEPFVNVAGCGFDAHVGHQFATYGKRGFSSYIKITLRELFNFKNDTYTITTNTTKYNGNAFLVTVSNGSQWGNNAYIAPNANISDGKLNVTVIKKITFLSFFVLVLKLFSKQIKNSTLTPCFTGEEITITQQKNIAHVDGEPIFVGNTIHIKNNPLSLNIIRP